MKILAIIPARCGSKGIPHKNIKLFKGKPLLAWSIIQAKKSSYINKIIVSTDSEKYQRIAISFGAETPFLRPHEISQDLSTDYQFIQHCLSWLNENKDYKPDIIVQLRPTYPTRSVKILDETIKLFIDNYDSYDSLRTVIPFEKSPYKMYRIVNNKLEPLFKKVDDIVEPYNKCRQELPKTYLHNGYIDIIKTDTIINKKSMTGKYILPYLMNMNEYHDIDNIKDWNDAENLFFSNNE